MIASHTLASKGVASLTMTQYAQIVIGPPGSGKSTYCNGMYQLLSQLGRQTRIINLDPANDDLPYQPYACITELITLSEVMTKLNLGPNGALVYCMEYLEQNITWLKTKTSDCNYYLIDCPGQIELYTHNASVKNIVKQFEQWNIKVITVNLVDSQYCSDPGKFLSVVMMSLSSMVFLETPHINILSKIDLINNLAPLAFGLDYYTEVQDLQYLLQHLSTDPFYYKYSKLSQCIADIVSDYSLVSYIPLNIQAKESVVDVLRATDKACGYVYQAKEHDTLTGLLSSVDSADYESLRFPSVREEVQQKET